MNPAGVRKVLVIGSGSEGSFALTSAPETRFRKSFILPRGYPCADILLHLKCSVAPMEIHLADLPEDFIIKLDDGFRRSLFESLDYNSAPVQLGVSKSYFYHLKNGRHGIRLSTLKKLLSLHGLSCIDAESRVLKIISSRGGKVFVHFPIIESVALAGLVGHCFGDGNISSKKAEFDYVNGDLQLIERVKTDVEAVFHSFPTYSGSNGDGTCKVSFSSLVGRILEIAGAPRGRKVFSILSVPDWIMAGTMELKKAFLQALFDDDGSVLYSENYAARNVNLHFTRANSIDLDFILYLEDIRKLLADFGIVSTRPYVARRYHVGDCERVVRGIIVNRKYDVRQFYNKINFTQKIKAQRLHKAVLRGDEHT
ncbi:MAG: LAGLIDADG family homing endonuclease [Candidatus Micrarchaeota archaeon]